MPARATNDFEVWYSDDLGPTTADNVATAGGDFEWWYTNRVGPAEYAAITPAFPTTPILDSFNRANENPLSGGGAWVASGRWGAAGLELVSNQVKKPATGTQQGSSWVTPIPESTESYVTLAVAPTGTQYIEFDLLKSTGADGYAWSVYGNGTSQPYRITSGGMTALGAGVPITLANGDGLGVKYDNTTNTYSGWWRQGLSGPWVKLFSVVDATHDGPWYLTYGLSAGTEIDDVGGGSIVVLPPQVVAPVADVADGGWTNELGTQTNLYASVSEVTAIDTDYLQSSRSPALLDEVKLRMAPTVDPGGAPGDHVVSFRCGKSEPDGDTLNLTVTLYRADGTTTIASLVYPDIETLTTVTLTLTGAEAATIPSADYATGLVVGLAAVKA